MRVLVVEDDASVAQTLELMLKFNGFKAYSTELGEEAVDLAKIYNYDAITLDLTLPDMTGIQALRAMRRAGVKTPVLVVTGRSDVSTRVEALDAGADDFLGKPFHCDELVARLHALIRRAAGQAEQKIVTGPIEVDIGLKTAAVAGRAVRLTGKEYAILELLSLRKGQTQSKEAFMLHMYGGMDEPEIKIVDVFICKLRKKLDAAAAGAGDHVSTVWGRGYCLVDTPPEAKKRQGGGTQVGAPLESRHAKMLIFMAAAARSLPELVAVFGGGDQVIRGALSDMTTKRHVENIGRRGRACYRPTQLGLDWLAARGWKPVAVAA